MDQNPKVPAAVDTHLFEFTTHQNEVIAELGNSLKWVSLPFFVLGTLCVLNFIFFILVAIKTGSLTSWHSIAVALMLIMQFLFFLLMSRWTTTASIGFLAITKTQGQDISFLMIALNNLRAMFSVLAFGVKLFLIISIISLIMSLVQYYGMGEPPRPTSPAATKAAPVPPTATAPTSPAPK